jgi:hypothetical protein
VRWPAQQSCELCAEEAATEYQLDEAVELLRDEDKEALAALAEEGRIAFTNEALLVFVSDAISPYTARVRVKGKPGVLYTRRYNLEETN